MNGRGRISIQFLLCLSLGLAVGCAGPSATNPQVDQAIIRASDNGRDAFNEGSVVEAIENYRSALHRAWAVDDPSESGMNAYNIAACLTSLARYAEAKDWLVDARSELCRANQSSGNTWLLDAKIAQLESRFEDAMACIDRAACACPPCGKNETGCCSVCCSKQDDPCESSCLTKIPCVGSKFAHKQAVENCQSSYQAQIHLARSSLAAEMYDIHEATRQLCCACTQAEEVCSEDLQAELQHVAAKIHLTKGEYLQAASHFDNEALHLRMATNHREIPRAIQAAGIAYESAGRPRLAAERFCRVARICFARGELRRSWTLIQTAIGLAEDAGCESTKIRLALLANEIGGTSPDADFQ